MAYKETFWMACDSTEQLRAEYGPFHTRAEAEQEARKLAFGYLLRYEHIIGDNEDIQEVRCIFVELPSGPGGSTEPAASPEAAHPLRHLRRDRRFTMRPGRLKCGPISTNSSIPATGSVFSSKPGLRDLKEIADWRDTCA